MSFDWLCAGPHPVTVDGRLFPGLPDQLLPLNELRARLLSRGCDPEIRDAVWAYLVGRSRTDGGTWTVACAGMALPVLGRVCRLLTEKFAGDPFDIHAAVLAGFLHGLARVDVHRRAVLVSLRWSAYRAGMAAVRDALSAPTPVTGARLESAPPPAPAGHPDLVLAQAVADRVITVAEAQLIGVTRLEHVRLTDAAAARGQSYTAAKTARHRAERRLLAYLTAPADPATASAAPTDRATHPGVTSAIPATSTTTGSTAGVRSTVRRRERNATRQRARSATTNRPEPGALPAGSTPDGLVRSGDAVSPNSAQAGVPLRDRHPLTGPAHPVLPAAPSPLTTPPAAPARDLHAPPPPLPAPAAPTPPPSAQPCGESAASPVRRRGRRRASRPATHRPATHRPASEAY
ncbi:sigma-70 family RNA polymerase sigma factor [Pseudonocardia nigra]|uniref:sigma-70 family RNA polymerase sigma factor n=1 Tax=Pseudonocardia nigra TaxID=1921578 RepID=UPI001C5EEC7A|nr:sigma-70 family RNA polymerase sigma factor [Pseudonocardia nigra]